MPKYCLLQERVTLHRLGKHATGDTGKDLHLNAAKIVLLQVFLFKCTPKQSAVTEVIQQNTTTTRRKPRYKLANIS